MGGAMPIPLVEIEAYCRMAGIEAADRFEFLRVIRLVDLLFLDAIAKRKTITLPQPKG
jgi:hypothetical protein